MYRLFQFAQQKKNHPFLCLILSSCPILVRVVWTMLSLAADGDKTFIFHTHRPPPQSKMFTTRRPARTTWTAKWGGFKLTNQAKQNEINQKNNLKNVNIVGEKMMSLAHVFFLFTARKVFDHDFCQFFLAAWHAVRRPIIFPFPHVGDEIARVLPTSWISCVTSS